MIELALPDLPRWVEAYGIAGDPHGWQEIMGDGFALGHDRARLIVVAGSPELPAMEALIRARPEHTVLLEIERDDLASVMRETGRPIERAILHTLPEPDALPELEGAVLLPSDASLDHVPGELAEELEPIRGSRPIWSAWVDGRPMSFAYAPWQSGRWFDVSVDTLAGARQLGLATIVAAAMIRDEQARGRQPVWGADEDNRASLRLASRLGFEACDALWVCPGSR